MEFLLRFKPLKQKETYLRTEKNNFPSVSLMATIIIETIITDSNGKQSFHDAKRKKHVKIISAPGSRINKCISGLKFNKWPFNHSFDLSHFIISIFVTTFLAKIV